MFKVGDLYLLFLAKPNQLPYSRLGLAISKKWVKRAVKRNFCKRAIRESFRLRQHEVIGLDIVVLAQRELNSLTKEQIKQNLEKKWRKLSKLQQNC